MSGDLLNQPLWLDGLRQVRFEATPERAVTGLSVIEGGDRDRRAWPLRSLCQELEAIEAGQLQISHEYVGRLGVEYKQGTFGIFDHRDDRPGLGELPRENVSRRLIVFDNENFDLLEGRQGGARHGGNCSKAGPRSQRGRMSYDSDQTRVRAVWLLVRSRAATRRTGD